MPQGSVFPPLIFLVYVSDQPNPRKLFKSRKIINIKSINANNETAEEVEFSPQ